MESILQNRKVLKDFTIFTPALMIKKVITYALISSPLLALYGVAPLYIFKVLNFNQSIFAFGGVLLDILLFWAINLFVIVKIERDAMWKVYLYSFLLGSVIQLPRILFVKKIPFAAELSNYIAYPAITTLAINVIILIICFSVLNTEKKQLAEKELAKIKLENMEAQKQTLMQQLQPHFLFNALSVLKSLITDNAIKAEQYTLQLSNFLRYSVEAHKSEVVTIEEELNFVNNYIQLQAVRFEDSFTFNVDIPKEELNNKLPVLALQTLVENAFKHNNFTSKTPMNISINFKDNCVHVLNNKSINKFAKKTDTGLKNLNNRYLLISNKSILIEDTANEFKVTIPVI